MKLITHFWIVSAALALTYVVASEAVATVGTPPITGPALQDGTWLNGVAAGQNNTYQSGISAAGTTQATATVLPNAIYMMEIDTVAGSSGVAIPNCVAAGVEFSIYNNTSTSLTIYPNATNNPVTSAQDTINNSTSVSLAGHTPEFFSCAKAGVWSAK